MSENQAVREMAAKRKAINAASLAEGNITMALDVAQALYEMMESDFELHKDVNDATFGYVISTRAEKYLNILFTVKSLIFDAVKEMMDEIDSIEYGLETE